MDDLSRFAEKYQTDKGPGERAGKYHFYTEHYDAILRDRRERVKRVLEIGVLWGSSLCMWRDYFPNATVTGIDIEPRTMLPDEPRITIVRDDASNPATRAAYATMWRWDLIVDDASHEFELMRDLATSLLQSADVYIIEDVPERHRDPLMSALVPVAKRMPQVILSRIPDHAALVYVNA